MSTSTFSDSISSTASSGSVEASSSQTLDSTSIAIAASSSSSVVVSSSSVPQCYTPQATNYVQNSGFETGLGANISPWMLSSQTSNRWTSTGVSTAQAGVSGNGLKGTTKSASLTTVTLSQTITNLEADISVYVLAYVKSLRDPSTLKDDKPTIFTLFFDDVQVDTFTVTAATNRVFQQLSSASSIRVTNSGTHQISLTISTSGANGDLYVADDFSIIPVVGPKDIPLCSPPDVPPRACLPAQSSNYVVNPGFDTLDPTEDSVFYPYWDVIQDNNWSPGSFVYSGYGRTGNAFRGYTKQGTDGAQPGTLILRQGGIAIPDGAIINVSAWVKAGRASTSANPLTVTLKFDDQTMDTARPTVTTRYAEYANTYTSQTVVAAGADPHSISLVVTTSGVSNADIFFVDDFSIVVLSGPNGQRLCAS